MPGHNARIRERVQCHRRAMSGVVSSGLAMGITISTQTKTLTKFRSSQTEEAQMTVID